MSIIFGLLSLIVSIALPLLILFLGDFQVLHFSVFFIVPIGALFIGYVCGYGYFLGLYKSNKYITGKHYLVGAFLALLCIFGIEFITYMFTCIDPETYEIVYSLKGDHISNYYADGYGDFDFFTFKKYMVENTPISFSYKRRSLGDISNPTFGWIMAIIDYLGLIIGALIAGSSRNDHPYCHSCNLYQKEKELFRIPKEEGENFFKRLEESLNNLDGVALTTLFNEIKANPASKNDEHFLCNIIYCNNCMTALFKFQLYQLKGNKLEENTEFKLEIEVPYDYIKTYIAA